MGNVHVQLIALWVLSNLIAKVERSDRNGARGMQEREVRAGRERLLRGEGEGEPDAADRLDAEGDGDEGELQAPDDLRGGHRQGRAAGTDHHTFCQTQEHTVLIAYWLIWNEKKLHQNQLPKPRICSFKSASPGNAADMNNCLGLTR